MSDTTYSKKTMRVLLYLQQGELTEHQIYSFLASRVKDEQNSSVLRRIAGEELGHAKIWQKLTEKEVKTNRIKFWFYSLMALILGYTFVLKKMEKGEDKATKAYRSLITEVPQAKQISEDEDRHEQQLLAMLDEERLQYVGSMVLGLSDALVELSGTLAGLTFALQNTRLIALSGLITGISATLSMASSEYLSAKNSGDKNAVKSSMYTGIAYLFTVTFMVLPYLLLESYAVALGIMLVVVIIIIMFFTYYTSVAKDLPFGKRFFEMALISLSVAAISFVIGILVKRFLGIDI
ncbi:VIT1/CCC1 transporter family protein [Sphaerochaeta halotolerans]|jgi:VIT1/CCC1 family predicted Fe2+/Mn2+ transporter|uniref:VIT1/CCC1 transporter family protein n=1 Tax=Sphaerochaeta halotolerans TaxID=2293840 RepID=UPI0013722029|nr:VIT1/CCC1 transporter family protein [Sphaerochaeta halotolerans]MXI86376.1 rubrerythrin family protein [Sphaerochaeta halotolerans]